MFFKAIFVVVLLQILQSCLCYGNTNDTKPIPKDNVSKDTGCVCSGYSCGCCVYLDVPQIKLNDSGCLNLSYLPKDYGIRFTVTIDSFALINMSVSARNPPPLCFGEEFLVENADICLEFYDLNATYTSLHGCAKIEVRFYHTILAKYELGCFDLGKTFKVGSSTKDKMNRLVFLPKVFAKNQAGNKKIFKGMYIN